MQLDGHVDALHVDQVCGWALDRADPARKLQIDIYINGQHAATVTADQHRPDLQAAGLGDGAIAFGFDPRPYTGGTPADVAVKFAGTERIVPDGMGRLTVPGATPPAANGGGAAGGSGNPWDRDEAFSYKDMWISAPECLKKINRSVTGDDNTHWLTYALNTYLAPALGRGGAAKPLENYRCLLLGSNEGHMELTLCRNGFRGQIVASDIAAKALARAKAKVEAEGFRNVQHRVADLNTDTFDGPFDFILAEGVLHHIERTEECLAMLRRALAPDGVLIMVEFVGPFRFQLPEPQVRWINAALAAMPKELRAFKRVPAEEAKLPATPKENGKIWYMPPSAFAVKAFDPSEAVGGENLKRLIPQMFDIVERKGFGGTLLSYITEHFDFKRTATDPFANAWLKVLMQIEKTAISTGILDDEFVFYVVRQKRA